MSDSVNEDVQKGQIWIGLLFAAGVANSLFFFRSATPKVAKPDTRSVLFAGIYTFVCFYRSIFMTDTHARMCFTDTPFNYAIVNRTLAAVAEISFGIMGVLTMRSVAECLFSRSTSPAPPRFVTAYIRHVLVPLGTFLCVTSNMNSHYGTLTRWSLPLILEEVGWFVYACATALAAFGVLFYASSRPGGRTDNNVIRNYETLRRLTIILFIGTVVFAVYLAAVDVPMYMAQYARESAPGANHVLFSLTDGLADSLVCRVVTQRWSSWHGVWLWQTLYFVFGPFSTSLQLRLISAVKELRPNQKTA